MNLQPSISIDWTHIKKEGDATIVAPCNIYGRILLGHNVFIGPFCEVQDQVKIGFKTRIQSHTFICSGVTIGDECFIGHGVMFTNDLLRGGVVDYAGDNRKTTNIGNRVVIGSGVTLLPVIIGNDIVIGAGSVVTKDLFERGTYAGNPAKKIGGL